MNKEDLLKIIKEEINELQSPTDSLRTSVSMTVDGAKQILLRILSNLSSTIKADELHSMVKIFEILSSFADRGELNAKLPIIKTFLDNLNKQLTPQQPQNVEPKIPQKPQKTQQPQQPVTEGLKYHIETKTSLFNPIYRPGSTKFNELMLEAKQRLNKGHNFTEAEADWLSTDVGLTGIYEGKVVPLDLPLIEEELNEAEYKGKQVQLGKPQRGGSKKFYVYVKDGDRVKKISFGDPNLSVKVGDAKRRASFVARHRCKEKNDRLTAGYWSCRIGRYPHLTGAKQRYTWW